MKHYKHLAKEKHIAVVAFFMVKPFGSNLPVLTYFSTLKPADRCIVLEMLFDAGQRNMRIYDKMVLAYVKDGKPEYAKEVIEYAKCQGEEAINIYGLKEKLDIGLPPERTDEQRIEILNNYIASTDNSLEIKFLNILLDFINSKD